MNVLYDWQTLPEFLAFALLPHATVLPAEPTDTAVGVLEMVPPGTRYFLFHLNCTSTARFPSSRPALIAALEARGIGVLNGALTDISKRAVQARCARLGLPTTVAPRHGDPFERVIVKTNSNYGGEIERSLSAEAREQLGLAMASDVIKHASDYPVLPRAEVPEAWWSDGGLVIERFVANQDHRWYRAFMFLSQLVIVEMINPQDVKKVGRSTVTRQWYFSDGDDMSAGAVERRALALRDAVTAVRVDAGLDFGAIDIMLDDHDVPYVIDINSTPAYYHPVPGLVEHLSRALDLPSRFFLR